MSQIKIDRWEAIGLVIREGACGAAIREPAGRASEDWLRDLETDGRAPWRGNWGRAQALAAGLRSTLSDVLAPEGTDTRDAQEQVLLHWLRWGRPPEIHEIQVHTVGGWSSVEDLRQRAHSMCSAVDDVVQAVLRLGDR